jgi:hypothetical protein
MWKIMLAVITMKEAQKDQMFVSVEKIIIFKSDGSKLDF